MRVHNSTRVSNRATARRRRPSSCKFTQLPRDATDFEVAVAARSPCCSICEQWRTNRVPCPLRCVLGAVTTMRTEVYETSSFSICTTCKSTTSSSIERLGRVGLLVGLLVRWSCQRERVSAVASRNIRSTDEQCPSPSASARVCFGKCMLHVHMSACVDFCADWLLLLLFLVAHRDGGKSARGRSGTASVMMDQHTGSSVWRVRAYYSAPRQAGS